MNVKRFWAKCSSMELMMNVIDMKTGELYMHDRVWKYKCGLVEKSYPESGVDPDRLIIRDFKFGHDIVGRECVDLYV